MNTATWNRIKRAIPDAHPTVPAFGVTVADIASATDEYGGGISGGTIRIYLREMIERGEVIVLKGGNCPAIYSIPKAAKEQ